MGAMRTHNPRMTPKVHVLIHFVPEYVRRTGVQLGPTFEQALASQHRFFDIFYHKFKVIVQNNWTEPSEDYDAPFKEEPPPSEKHYKRAVLSIASLQIISRDTPFLRCQADQQSVLLDSDCE